jgi:thioredoxin 1
MAHKEIVSEITQAEFPKIINDKKNKVVIVDFFAEWCMPCVIMAPVLHRLAEKYSVKGAKFVKINVDDAQQLSMEYEVSGIPCIVFFQDGKEVDRVVGAGKEEILNEKISDYLKVA